MISSLKLGPLSERIYWGHQKNVTEFLTPQNRFLLKNLKHIIGYTIDAPVFSSSISDENYGRLQRCYEQCFNASVTKNTIDFCIKELDRLFKDAFDQKIPFKQASCNLKHVVKKMLIAKPSEPIENICNTILHLSFVFNEKELSYEQSTLIVEKIQAKRRLEASCFDTSMQDSSSQGSMDLVQRKIDAFVDFLNYKKALLPFTSIDHLASSTNFWDKVALKKRLVDTVIKAIPGSHKYINEDLEIDLRGIVRKNIKRNPNVDFFELCKKVQRLTQLLTNHIADSDQLHETFNFILSATNKTAFYPSIIDISIQNIIFYHPRATLDEIISYFEEIFPNPHNDLIEAKIYHIIRLYLLSRNKLLEVNGPLMRFLYRYKGFFPIDSIPSIFSKECAESLYLSYLINQFEEICAMTKDDIKRHINELFASLKDSIHLFEILSCEYNDIVKTTKDKSIDEIAEELNSRFEFMLNLKKLLQTHHTNLSEILHSLILYRDDLIDIANAMTLFCQKKCLECLTFNKQATSREIFTSIIRAYPKVLKPHIREKITLWSRNRFIISAFNTPKEELNEELHLFIENARYSLYMPHEIVIDKLCNTYGISRCNAESFYINWWLTRNRSQELPDGKVTKQSIAKNALSSICIEVFHKNIDASFKDMTRMAKQEFKKLCPDIPFEGFEANNLLFNCKRFSKKQVKSQ